MVENNEPGIAATLLTRPFDKANDRWLDSRVAQEPGSLTGGAEGKIFFAERGLEWHPARFHPHFRALNVAWSEVNRVQVVAPLDGLDKIAWAASRETNGYIRVFCRGGLIEFSFVLTEGQEVYDGFLERLNEGQVRVVQPGEALS